MKSIFTIIILMPLCIYGCRSVKESNEIQPNILFIMSDDHAYQAISAYDNTLIETPNIDRLANEGMLFSNACVSNSICALLFILETPDTKKESLIKKLFEKISLWEKRKKSLLLI